VVTRSRPEDILIITKPDVLETINVDYLAGVFNLSKGEITGRIIEVPDDYGFGSYDINKNWLAIVLDKRFFRIYPTLYEGSSILNPASLVTNTFLTTEWVFSYGTFFNGVVFTKDSAPDKTITISSADTNYLAVSDSTPAVGSSVTATFTRAGYLLKKLTYDTPSGSEIVLYDGDGKASGSTVVFTMPPYDITLKGAYAQNVEITITEDTPMADYFALSDASPYAGESVTLTYTR